MTATQTESPSATVTRCQLSRAPLVRVLCQVQWLPLSKVNSNTIQPIADQLALAIADEYPFRETAQEMRVTITPAGVEQQAGRVIHRFVSADRTWTVTLSDLFLAVETAAYSGHGQFIDRLERAMAALTALIEIPYLVRLGYRYTDRLTGQADLGAIETYFKPELLGGVSQRGPFELAQSVTESVFKTDGSSLRVRSALLAPRMAITPDLAPVDVTSWVLDLDSVDEPSSGITPNSIGAFAEALSSRASDYFWSMVSEPFVERFQ